MNINYSNTALILIGYQNDYFAKDGILTKVVEEFLSVINTLSNTLGLLDAVTGNLLIISTPITFTPNYAELDDPVGILKTIKEVKAFQQGSSGAQTIPQIQSYGDSIIEIPGKIGLNAFINTNLGEVLKQKNITNLIMAGCVTSICIDSTGRSAFEQGYKVGVLSDCTSGRSSYEQKFYCDSIFPLYSRVLSSSEMILELNQNSKKYA
ncbi:MAG: cysteine hydrolase family protein [Rickettsiales bacterium]|mgnify:FL=1|jgi:nicotinamidase-related amidase|nr:cysteine hydrolase family protein [Rickettsiales bacterium]